MKQFVKQLGIIAILAIIGLGFTTCDGDDDVGTGSNDSGNGGGTPGLRYYYEDDYCYVSMGTASATAIVIPSKCPDGHNVTAIGSGGFRTYYYPAAANISSITIPDSVTYVGDFAFSGSGIWNNTPNNSVVYADKWAVGYKGTESEVNILESTVGIGNTAFFECTSLTGITIPDSVTSIGGGAFDGCTNLTGITIPDSVTSIGGGAFDGCTSLTSIIIPVGVTSIGLVTFRNCTNLRSVTFEGSITSENLHQTAFGVSGGSGSGYGYIGDLRAKYLAGGPGTYTRPYTGIGSTHVWTKQQ